LTEFCHCARESLEIFFRTVLGLPDGIPGLVMVIHTFDFHRLAIYWPDSRKTRWNSALKKAKSPIFPLFYLYPDKLKNSLTCRYLLNKLG
jgi:hypothetical protein